MQKKIVPLSELPLSDDFMFGEVMRQEKVCRLFLEALLEKKIAQIAYIDKQKDLTDGAAAHGIRLDVYLSDEKNTHYDIEMQKFNRKSLEMRIRYYQSGIDRRTLEKSDDYKNLSNSYVIFVCDFDYYKKGAAKYERTSFVNGWLDVPYDDGSHAIILNSHYKNGNTSHAILEFLDYIRTNDDAMQMFSELGREAKKAVMNVRDDKTKEVQYMTWAMKMQDIREDAWEEGLEEGFEKGIVIGEEKGIKIGEEKGIQIGHEDGIQGMIGELQLLDLSQERIAQALCRQFGLSTEAAQEKIHQYWDA